MARVESVQVFHSGHVVILRLFPWGFLVELNSRVQKDSLGVHTHSIRNSSFSQHA